MRNLLVLLLVSAALPPVLAGDASQLWLDHAVSSSDHVVRGTYEGGRLDVAVSLKGSKLPLAVAVDRDEVELRPADLAPGAPRMKGAGVFFLQGRFDGKGADARRFIEWQGVQGVAWEGTVAFLGYRPTDDERFAIADIASRTDFERMLEASLGRDRALGEALAVVDSKARATKLAELVRTAHDAPDEAVSELGPDPFAQRALTEIGLVGEAETLEALRRETKLAWVKTGAVRALAATPSSEKKLEAIALDSKATEDEVVTAIDMLFSSEHASVKALEKLSFDERPRVRRSVASALREKVKDLETLERLMKDPDPSVRGAATDAARAAARRLELPMPGEKKPVKEDE